MLGDGALERGRDSRLAISRVAAGQVVVTGAITTPTPCYAVRPELVHRGRTLTLRLEARSQPMMCAQVLATFAYQARISHLDSGQYTLEVVASYPGTGRAERVDRLQLQIP